MGLVENIRDTDKVSSWNYTLTEARVLKRLRDTVAISYQITTDAAGGMVSARDFIYISKVGYDGEEFIMGGKSVEMEDGPKSCDFIWLMDCQYKGMMLQTILDVALPIAQ